MTSYSLYKKVTEQPTSAPSKTPTTEFPTTAPTRGPTSEWGVWVDDYGCKSSLKDEDRSFIKGYNETLDAAKETCFIECSKSADCEIAELYFQGEGFLFWSYNEQACTLISRSKIQDCEWMKNSGSHMLLKEPKLWIEGHGCPSELKPNFIYFIDVSFTKIEAKTKCALGCDARADCFFAMLY